MTSTRPITTNSRVKVFLFTFSSAVLLRQRSTRTQISTSPIFSQPFVKHFAYRLPTMFLEFLAGHLKAVDLARSLRVAFACCTNPKQENPSPCPLVRSIRIFTALATLGLCAAAYAGKPGESLGRTHTTIERMAPERLEAAQQDARRYQSQRRTIAPLQGLHDYRAILHAHASDSAHTGGTSEEILADAKAEGVDVIMLSDHFRPPKDFMDSWRGLKDGVLFIPGSEGKGFLLYPEKSVFDEMSGPKEGLIAATGARNGMLFLSHVEERMGHSMEGLTGMEIYNRHHDANDDMALLFTLVQWATDPDDAARIAGLIEKYPDEILGRAVGLSGGLLGEMGP